MLFQSTLLTKDHKYKFRQLQISLGLFSLKEARNFHLTAGYDVLCWGFSIHFLVDFLGVDFKDVGVFEGWGWIWGNSL